MRTKGRRQSKNVIDKRYESSVEYVDPMLPSQKKLNEGSDNLNRRNLGKRAGQINKTRLQKERSSKRQDRLSPSLPSKKKGK